MKTKVDTQKVQEIIKRLEATKSYKTRGDLWEEVREIYNKENNDELTTGKIRTAAYKLVDVQTPSAKPNCLNNEKTVQNNNDNKIPKRNISKESIEKLQKHFHLMVKNSGLKESIKVSKLQQINKAIKQASRGSLKAAVKLNCWDCTALDNKEVKTCELQHCPFWNFRPYK